MQSMSRVPGYSKKKEGGSGGGEKSQTTCAHFPLDNTSIIDIYAPMQILVLYNWVRSMDVLGEEGSDMVQVLVGKSNSMQLFKRQT